MTTILYPVFGRADRRKSRQPALPCAVIAFPAPLRKPPQLTCREPGGEGASGGGGRRRRGRRS